jgi:hypothetical protein
MVQIACKYIVKLIILMQTNIYLRFRGFVPVSSVAVHVLMDGRFSLSNTSLKMAENGRNM